MTDFDVVVIGGGVVGLAIGERVASLGLHTALIERHSGFGQETSSRNSEVIHAGLYYQPGSLKARLCTAGNQTMYAWCRDHDVPHRRVGKLILATTNEEEAHLAGLLERARANGVRRIEWFPLAKLRQQEPCVRAKAALWSPDSGILDSHRLLQSLVADAARRGCEFVLRHEVVGVARDTADGYRLLVRQPDSSITSVTAKKVVNSAGLQADGIAALAGLDVEHLGYTQHYCLGSYFRVSARKNYLARHLLYPSPLPALIGLGIHVTLDMGGGIRLGPHAQYLSERQQVYQVDETLGTAFLCSVSRFLTGLELEDLSPDQSGIRPKLQGPNDAPKDFLIREESERGLPGWVNLIGIDSPGLTCSLEIGKLVASMVGGTTGPPVAGAVEREQ